VEVTLTLKQKEQVAQVGFEPLFWCFVFCFCFNVCFVQSPYSVGVTANVSAERTVCSGPGLKDGNKDTVPTHFTIETRLRELRKEENA
jgi:hypothetical protein